MMICEVDAIACCTLQEKHHVQTNATVLHMNNYGEKAASLRNISLKQLFRNLA